MRSAILAAAILVFASACAATSATDGSEGAAAADSVGTNFVQDLKTAYEKSGGTGNAKQTFLQSVTPIDGKTLKGAAASNWGMYESSSEEGLINFVGAPIVEEGTFEGKTVIYVAGDDSDTGSELGFYNPDGSIIAVAYSGQGEEMDPHENGVDWNTTTPPAANDGGTTTTTDAGAPAGSQLVTDLKHAYETAGGAGIDAAKVLTGVTSFDPKKLAGAAKDNWGMYEGTYEGGGINSVGEPVVQSGTFEGKPVIYVAGDDSDTGSEFGFYNQDGSVLAVAYSGQGEHPGAGGVDWD